MLGGLGGAAIYDASVKDPKSDRASAALGIGVERRFGHLGISAELRAIGVSPVNADAQQSQAMPLVSSTTTTPPPAADNGYGGGAFSVGVSYDF